MKNYIWRIKHSTQNLACSQRQIHTEYTYKLSQVKTAYKQPLPTHNFRKCNYTQ